MYEHNWLYLSLFSNYILSTWVPLCTAFRAQWTLQYCRNLRLVLELQPELAICKLFHPHDFVELGYNSSRKQGSQKTRVPICRAQCSDKQFVEIRHCTEDYNYLFHISKCFVLFHKIMTTILLAKIICCYTWEGLWLGLSPGGPELADIIRSPYRWSPGMAFLLHLHPEIQYGSTIILYSASLAVVSRGQTQPPRPSISSACSYARWKAEMQASCEQARPLSIQLHWLEHNPAPSLSASLKCKLLVSPLTALMP